MSLTSLFLASCLGSSDAPPTTKSNGDAPTPRAGNFTPQVVATMADSGVNPYHEIYYRPDLTEHPCTYVQGYDCSIPALPLSIGKYATWQEAFEADRALWASVKPHQWYWIPKT
ncbi:MAG: hypothetical protein HYV95_06255 [Opitutae bacterium]|nr:hypothetical protein [Opitutae bacterium]